MIHLEKCPGCHALLPAASGAEHPYVDASSSCWQLFSALNHGGQPPLAPAPLNGLLLDAYIAQHHVVRSDQSIQSVAVHLLALHGVLDGRTGPQNVLWIRQRAVRGTAAERHARWRWLDRPDFAGSPTIAALGEQPSPADRTAAAEIFIREIWRRWAAEHSETVAAWYERFILPDRL